MMNALKKVLVPAVFLVAALTVMTVGTALSQRENAAAPRMSSVTLTDPLWLHRLTDEGLSQKASSCDGDCAAGKPERTEEVIPVTGENSMRISGLTLRITPEPTQVGGCQAVASQEFIDKVLELVNEERTKQGLGILIVEPRLTEAARKHSQDMACRNYFSHTSPDGASPFDRMAAEGYTMDYAAENLYAGNDIYNTPQMAISGWLNSPSHRASMLNPMFDQVGIGYYYNSSTYLGGFVTMDFGRKIPSADETQEPDNVFLAPVQ